MLSKEDILNLAFRIPKLFPGPTRKFVTNKDIDDYEKKHRIHIPIEYREWLLIGNGVLIEPGAVYGINLIDDAFEIAKDLIVFPSWRKNGWLPVAGDGCGCYYVMDTAVKTGQTHPIYFIDLIDFDHATYVVASGLWKFLYFLFTEQILLDQGKDYFWPFDKEKVIAEDPDILLCKTAPLPWEADADDNGNDDNDNFWTNPPQNPKPAMSIKS